MSSNWDGCKSRMQWSLGLQVVDVRITLAQSLGNRMYPQWFAELPDIHTVTAILRYEEVCMFSNRIVVGHYQSRHGFGLDWI